MCHISEFMSFNARFWETKSFVQYIYKRKYYRRWRNLPQYIRGINKINSRDQALLDVVEVTLARNRGRRSVLLAREPMTSSINLAQKLYHCCVLSHALNLCGKSYCHWARFSRSEWALLMFHFHAGYSCETSVFVRENSLASRVALVWACVAYSLAKSDKACL